MSKVFSKIFQIASGILMALSVLGFIYFDSTDIGFHLFLACLVGSIIAAVLE